MPTRMSATSYSGVVVYICTSVIKESSAAARVPFAASARGCGALHEDGPGAMASDAGCLATPWD